MALVTLPEVKYLTVGMTFLTVICLFNMQLLWYSN